MLYFFYLHKLSTSLYKFHTFALRFEIKIHIVGFFYNFTTKNEEYYFYISTLIFIKRFQ